MTPRDVYAKALGETLAERPDTPLHWSMSTRVPLADLAGIVDHHTMRRVMVSTEHFGLADMPKGSILRKLHDEWFKKGVQRVLDKDPALRVEASVGIKKKERVAHEAYELSIHTIGAWTGDGKIWIVS